MGVARAICCGWLSLSLFILSNSDGLGGRGMEGFPWDRQSPHERRFGMSYTKMMAKPSHEIDISYILPSQSNSISVPFLKMGLEEKVFRNPLINMCALIHVR